MISFWIPLAVLLVLPRLVLPFATHSGPTALVGGCYLGYAAFLGGWAARSRKAWLGKIGQANLLVAVGWLALCGGQMIAGREAQNSLTLLPLGVLLLATICTTLESVQRRKLQFNLRESLWWMAVFALVAAMAPRIVREQQPDSPLAAVMLLVAVSFRLILFSLFASFVAVPTIVVWDNGTSLPNKLVRLVLVWLAGATLLVTVVSGLGYLGGSLVGSLPKIFIDGLCLDLGVMAMIVGSSMLVRHGPGSETSFHSPLFSSS